MLTRCMHFFRRFLLIVALEQIITSCKMWKTYCFFFVEQQKKRQACIYLKTKENLTYIFKDKWAKYAHYFIYDFVLYVLGLLDLCVLSFLSNQYTIFYTQNCIDFRHNTSNYMFLSYLHQNRVQVMILIIFYSNYMYPRYIQMYVVLVKLTRM